MTTASILPRSILQIDTQHLGRSKAIASYVLLGSQPALVDPGPASALTGLEAGLAAHGMRIEDLSVLLLTHIHLDHAGATGTLVRRNPDLHVYVHQRGAPHMIDPEKLLRSATRLYGEHMDYLWGEFLPVPAENVTALAGGEILTLGDRQVHVYDAPGHANHHVLYHEPATGVVWVGDNGGIRMPEHSYVRPATPPPDIDLEAFERTWQQLERLKPRILALTHYGAYDDPQRHIDELRQRMAAWASLVRQGIEDHQPEAEQIAALEALAASELGSNQPPDAHSMYGNAAAVDQCWQGLARYWRKQLEQG